MAVAASQRHYYKRERSWWELLPTVLILLTAIYLIGQGIASQVSLLVIGGLALLLLVALLVTREIALRSTAESGIIATIRPFFLSRGQEDSRFKRLMINLALIVACIIAAYPVLRIFSVSLRPGQTITSTDLSIIPEGASWEHYRDILFGNAEKRREGDFFLWMWNSLLITGATAVVGVMIAATAAYGFSRFKFRGRSAGMIFFLTTQMIPAGMLLLPLYLMLANLGLTNSYLGMVVAYSVTSVPFSIWILKGYYDTIPFDLEEAAMIDGTSQLGAFWRILIPLSTPALAIVFLFNFMAAWSEYMVANVIIKTEMMRTWPLGLQQFSGSYSTAFGRFAATSILVAFPVMILFLYSSKWLLGGLTLGSVKG